MITREDITVTLQILKLIERDALGNDDDFNPTDFKSDIADVAELLQRLLNGEPVDLTNNGGKPRAARSYV